MVSFDAFSSELAEVLKGIATASNCFSIKAIYISPSRKQIDFIDTGPTATPPPVVPEPKPVPRDVLPRGASAETRAQREIRMLRQQMQRMQQESAGADEEVVQTSTTKILWEKPLFVTIYIDVVKLKPPEPPAPVVKPVAKPMPMKAAP